MKPPPTGWPRLSSSVFYDDAAKAIDWLCRAFGFETQLKIEAGDGTIVHSQLVFGGGLVMVGSSTGEGSKGRAWQKSPRSTGGACTQAIMLYVDDADAHCARARDAGATIAMDPRTSDYGDDYWTDRSYEAVDLEGHHWWFVQRISTGKNVAP